jgi:hypothetical protein
MGCKFRIKVAELGALHRGGEVVHSSIKYSLGNLLLARRCPVAAMTTTKAPTPQSDRPAPKQEAPQVEGGAPTAASLAAAYQQLTPRAVLQLQKTIGNRATMRLIQRRMGNDTPSHPSGGSGGLPAPLKAGIEALSGADMSDVQVHHNSSDAGNVNALAYAQGNQIHVARGQEKHLPHEAWHVVQQKLGRVQATGTVPGGRALNDDPALEAEADRMGAQAASHTPPVNDTALQRIPADADAPIQGVFTQEGQWQRDEKGPKNAYYINQENKVRYELVGYGPGEGIHPYFWVAPADNLTAKVAIRPIKGNESQWEALDENIRKLIDIRATVRKPTEDAHPETGLGTDKENEEELGTLGSFSGGKVTKFPLEVAEERLKLLYSISKFTTGFNVLVSTIPIAEGVKGTGDFKEQRYTPDQLLIGVIMVGDQDRPDTQFENQESHTVAWTLARNSIMRLAGRTAKELLQHFAASFQELSYMVEEKEGQLLLNAATAGGTLEIAQSGQLPILLWQELFANLIRLYMQVYQISTAATYKRGTAKGHGEAPAMEKLREDEQTLATGGTPTRNGSQMSTLAEKMLDVQFRLQSLGLLEYAFAVNHWIDSLKLTFPRVMAKHGDTITNDALNKKVAPSFKKELLSRDKDAAWVTTVRDLLNYYDYPANTDDVKSTKPDLPKVTTSGVVTRDMSGIKVNTRSLTIPSVNLGRLETDFVANVFLAPQEGTTTSKAEFLTQLSTGVSSIAQVDVATAEQMVVKKVLVSDTDRPQTKFITAQKSHTVAWTLVRHQMMSLAGKTLGELLGILEKNFTKLATDVSNASGKNLVAVALDTIKIHKGETYPDFEWQQLASALLRWYAIAYQVAESSAYINPEEAERAKGHGEAHAMRKLRRTEFALSSGGNSQDSEKEVIDAATTLLDAFVSVRLSEMEIVRAFEHWRQALTEGFPSIMKVSGVKIIKEMSGRKVTETGGTFAEIISGQKRDDLLN